MSETDGTQSLIIHILDYMIKKNIPAFVYCESADDEQHVIRIKVSLKTKEDDCIPAATIKAMSMTDEERNLISEITDYLTSEKTGGFTYRCHPAAL